MNETYSETGGARFGATYWGAWNIGWPLAKLTVARDSILLTLLWRKHLIFERESVLAIRRYRGLISTGAQIVHAKTNYPVFILFWTWSFDHLASQLDKLEYRVEK